jgi:hypothetical protein
VSRKSATCRGEHEAWSLQCPARKDETVELIQIRKIKALASMRLFLEQISLSEQLSLPEQLSELYTTLLSRNSSNDPENKELAALALKILAAACNVHRP